MITLLEITLEEAINHEKKDYNPRIWSQSLNRYAERNAKFYTSIHQSQYGYRSVYAIYMVDDFRVIQEVSYSSSLSSAPMQSYELIKNKWLNKLSHSFSKDVRGRSLAKLFSSNNEGNMVGDYLLEF
jgi:hypothetical protein